jgi:hypothetical protein
MNIPMVIVGRPESAWFSRKTQKTARILEFFTNRAGGVIAKVN